VGVQSSTTRINSVLRKGILADNVCKNIPTSVVHHISSFMAIRNQSGQRLHRFTLTLNNYTEDEYDLFKQNLIDHCKFAVLGREVGAEGTKHLQGAGVLKKQTSFSTLKMLFPKAHLENMRGSPDQNLTYCTKEDLNAFVHGELPHPGKTQDLVDASALVQQGSTLRAIAVTHPTTIVKFFKGLSVLRSLSHGARTPDNPPCVLWLHGPTGTNKTREAWAYGCSTFGEDETLILPDATLQWFDLYDGQKCVIIDDFRSKKVNFSFLLRVLDRYPLSVPIKGAYINWIPECIIITTPHDTDRTFEHRFRYIPEDINQLNRRITRRIQFPLGPGESLRSLVSTTSTDQPTTMGGHEIRGHTNQSNSNGTGSHTGLQSPLVIEEEPTMYQCVDCFEFFIEVNSSRRCKDCGKKKDK